MKKVVSVMAALILCFAMSVTCFAASPVKVTAKSTNVTVAEVTEGQATAIAQVATKEGLKTVLGDKVTETASVIATFDLQGTAGEVELNVTGIKAGDSVVVLHWVDGDMTKAPEVLSATASDGAIKFTTSSLSPFAIVKLASADGSAASPKTGEATMAVVALMLLSAAGIVVLNRKKLA